MIDVVTTWMFLATLSAFASRFLLSRSTAFEASDSARACPSNATRLLTLLPQTMITVSTQTRACCKKKLLRPLFLPFLYRVQSLLVHRVMFFSAADLGERPSEVGNLRLHTLRLRLRTPTSK